MTKFARIDKSNADYKTNGKLVGVFLKGPVEIQIRENKPVAPNHVGLLFSSGGKTRLFHFTDDHENDEKPGIHRTEVSPTAKIFHAPIGFDHMNASGFAAYLGIFLDDAKLPKIKYGLDWFDVLGAFDRNGIYKFDGVDDAPGMTCATFVSELFSGFGHQLVDSSKWVRDPVSEEDLKWREQKLRDFEARNKYTQQRRDHMASIDPFVRLRPDEVGAVAAEHYGSWESLEHHRDAAPAPDEEGQEGSPEQPKPTIEELAVAVVQAFAAVDWKK